MLCLIDGYNNYHAIDDLRLNHLKWLNYRAFFECFLKGKQVITSVLYFTTIATWRDAASIRNHETYIRALETVGVKTIRGRFNKERRKEKETDVNIAVHIVKCAMQGCYDDVMLLSGDADFLPALRIVRRLPVPKQVYLILPIGRSTTRLRLEADYPIRTRLQHLQRSQFPDTITLKSGKTVCRPPEWK